MALAEIARQASRIGGDGGLGAGIDRRDGEWDVTPSSHLNGE
jgi:hypothetical protein